MATAVPRGARSRFWGEGVEEQPSHGPLSALTVLPAGLQNDHKALMKQVEEALHQLHAREKEKQAKDQAEALAEALSQSQSQGQGLAQPQAFARVNAVTPESPASASVSPWV